MMLSQLHYPIGRLINAVNSPDYQPDEVYSLTLIHHYKNDCYGNGVSLYYYNGVWNIEHFVDGDTFQTCLAMPSAELLLSEYQRYYHDPPAIIDFIIAGEI